MMVAASYLKKIYVTVFTKDDTIILRGWREPSGAKLWRFSLSPEDHPSVPPEWSSVPTALNAHDLPSVGSLVRYLHAATGFPVKSTWLAEIKAGNYDSWPSLTYSNAYKYCPVSVQSLQGHLTQYRQGARSTKPKPDPVPITLMTKSMELYITTEPISNLYTDDMGRFPVRSRSGNNFIMLSYYVDTNVFLVEPLKSHHKRHRLAAADRIMTRPTKRVHGVNLQILDKKCSAAYKLHIEEKWGGKVPTRCPLMSIIATLLNEPYAPSRHISLPL